MMNDRATRWNFEMSQLRPNAVINVMRLSISTRVFETSRTSHISHTARPPPTRTASAPVRRDISVAL